MKKSSLIFGLFIGLFSAMLIGVPIAEFLNVSPTPVVASIVATPFLIKFIVRLYLGFLPEQSRFAFMAVQKEIWVDYIIGNLFKDNSFLSKCYNESDSVLNGVVVHIPQAGAKPGVVKNRTSLPAQISKRADSDVNYSLDWFTTDPITIQDAEKKELSYDKVNSVLGEHTQALDEVIADEFLYKWAPTAAAQILRTTGAADNVALSTGATGTRKALVGKDLRRAQAIMNKQGIPLEERFALIPEDMLTQLLADTTLTDRDYQKDADLKEGIVARLYGFNIMTRAHAGIYDNTGTPVPKVPGTAAATTDNLAVLCWQKNAVSRAMGSVNFYEDLGNPTMYGDVYSADVRCGGRKRRTNGEGVVAIVQEP